MGGRADGGEPTWRRRKRAGVGLGMVDQAQYPARPSPSNNRARAGPGHGPDGPTWAGSYRPGPARCPGLEEDNQIDWAQQFLWEPGPDMDPVPMGAGTEDGLGSLVGPCWSSISDVALSPAVDAAHRPTAAWRAPPPSAGLTPPDVAWPVPRPVPACRKSRCPSSIVGKVTQRPEMTSKTDVTFDTGSNTKSENLPVQVTSIRLNKDNYLSWSAALEIGITSRGRLPYITGEKPAPSKTDPGWATWALEDSQVKGDLSVASFYAALKTKWEELDYHVNDDWNCGSDHELYWQKEWMDRTFIFLGGLRDEFDSIRSQILNYDETPGIEEVYARVESEEQRRQGLGSVLFGVAVTVTSWDTQLIFVGIFILRRGSPVVDLPLEEEDEF
ncbi:hypothetical protein EJ110_NYTH19480 [Nymphaea thermarum]|nr:hypothetical protein EJ110_NYTH19480 [Nymphaea thermarum]